MEAVYRTQINLMTSVVLILIFLIAYRKLEKNNQLNRAFLVAVAGVVIGLLAESVTVFLNGSTNAFGMILDNIFSVIIFALAPMISFYFFIFIFQLVLPGAKLNKVLSLICAIPIITNVVLAVLSPFFGFFFSISSAGIYSRGPLFLLSASSTYIFMITGIILVLININRLMRQDFWLIFGIGIVPILGGILQSLFYGVLAMWSSAGIALILGYLFLQERMIRLDSLTGAWNRESFYFTFSRRIQLTPHKKFGAIYFDIDNLKMINDTYGHLEGDKAIVLVMELIRAVLPPDGIICRLGGDEFIIICDCEKEEKINLLLENIKKEFITNEEVKKKKYPLKCSFGTAIFTSEYFSLNAFLSKLDILMYEEKFSKK